MKFLIYIFLLGYLLFQKDTKRIYVCMNALEYCNFSSVAKKPVDTKIISIVT